MLKKNQRKIEVLLKEVERLRDENLKLLEEKLALDLKLFKLYTGELEEKLTDELELTSDQRSKLALLCSIETARLAGVKEDNILHNLDEINKFFLSGES